VRFTDISVKDFLTRLLVEQPCFDTSPVLGLSLIKIMYDFGLPNKPSYDLVTQIMSSDAGLASLEKALEFYEAEGRTAMDCITLCRKYSFVNDHGFMTPAVGAIPVIVAELIISRGNGIVCRGNRPGRPAGRFVARSAGDLSRL
jgi:hypothetical protein